MTIRVYATTGDLTGGDPPWLVDLPANAGSLLRSASLLIATATISDYYDADDAGLPTVTAIVEAFRDATCAQVALWATLGIDPNLAGLDVTAPKRAKGIGSAKVEYDTSAASSAAALATRQQLARGLCEQSQRILRSAGMLSTRSWTYG